jgi:SAM-dependent methyltransferase
MNRELPYNERHYLEAENFGPGCWTAKEQRRLEMIGALVPERVRTILDVGSGGGEIVLALRSRGYHVTATDYSLAALSLYPGERVLCDCRRLPFPDGAFHLVTCTEVLEHLDGGRYEAARREMARVALLYVLISVPNGEDLRQSLVRCRACRYLYTLYGHIRTFRLDQMAGLIPGFAIVRQEVGQEEEVGVNRFLLWLRQHVGRRWAYWEHAVCPHCGTRPLRPGRRNVVVLACDFLNNRIPWRPRRRTPLYVLYRRQT